MAKIGTADIASRYDGIGTGPRFGYSFEVQQGVPIDGGNANNRNLSPFRLRLIVPDALLTAAAQVESGVDLLSSVGAGSNASNAAAVFTAQARAVDLISAAAQGADQNALASELASSLARVSAINTDRAVLESFVSGGQFLSNQSVDYFVTLADAFTAADIALQLQQILAAPALTLLVNPNNMTIAYNNIQSYATRTRQGYVFERWGEDQPAISFQGSTGSFMAGATNAPGTITSLGQVNGETTGPTGVQFASRRDSAAWQNLQALIHFYQNNGYIYDIIGQTEAHLLIGAVAIDYDQWTYVGHIESFDYSFQAGTPNRVEWSMEFKVDRMFDNAQPATTVLPQTAPTESPGFGVSGNGVATGSFGVGTVESSFDPGSEFGVIPFELLTP